MTDDEPRPRRHLNQSQKRGMRVGDVATFIRQYGRKAQKDKEPNDRRYSEAVERKVKRMDPVELDRLMREDED